MNELYVMIRIGIVMFMLLRITDLSAQFPKALVHTITGKASIVRNGKPVLLKQKDQIFDYDTIDVKKNCTLTLVYYDQKFIDIKKAGRYTCPDLQSSLNVRQIGISRKFFEMIYHEFFKPEHENGFMNIRAIGGATGGASRGGSCNLLLEPVNRSKLVNDTISFVWSSVAGTASYLFTLENKNHEELMNMVTPDTSLYFLKKGFIFSDKDFFFWRVTADSSRMEPCDRDYHFFQLVTVAEKQEAVNEVIKKVPMEKDLFLYNIKLSNLLGNEGWFDEALHYYARAMEEFTKLK